MKHPAWRKFALLLVIAFAVRLAAGWVWQSRLGDRFGLGDTESYWSLAQAIAGGRPYELGADHAQVFRTPGYPIVLAPIFSLTSPSEGDRSMFSADGSSTNSVLSPKNGPVPGWSANTRTAVLLARAEAALLGTLAVLALWWLARLLFDDRTALLAAVLATFYPGAVVLGVLILSEAPFCPLMLLQLAFWTLAWNAPRPGRRAIFAIFAGLAAGAATLMRPSWLLFTPFAAGVGIVVCSSAFRRLFGLIPAKAGTTNSTTRHAVIAFWMILGLVAVMTPWWIRNARVTGRFVPTTLQVGASMYDGLSPEATGASNMEFVERFEAEERRADDEMPLEQRLDRRMREESLAWARENPGRVVQLVGIKFLRMWNFWPNEPQLAANRIVCWGVFFTYTPLLIFAIIGACRTVGRGWPYLLCCLPAVYLTLLHCVFVSSIRYREPAMLALLALAAAGMMRVKKKPLAASQ